MRLFTLCLLLLLPAALAAQPVTGLAGWSVVIDPGHSFTQNQGAFGYSEAEKTLAVGLELARLLRETTDIDTVYMTRTRGDIEVSLTERTTYANQVGAAYFHSIHSDAGSTTANSTLIMYGGWRENGQTVEKTPQGGRRMGDLMDVYLTEAMRTTRRGNYADRTFYQGFPFEHANKFPYLHVNRESNMASTLSEAGFHTNPEQNQRNMNADWKRLEARALYLSMLRFRGASLPTARIVTGILRDLESRQPVNGATIEVAGKTYTTDTYASLFNRFTNDPDLLRNGFYYLEDVPQGTHQVTVGAANFAPFTTTVAPIDTFFTFLDIDLVSTVAPFVAASTPDAAQQGFRVISPIALTFSRPMDRASVEAAFGISPQVAGTFAWSAGDRTVTFTPDSLKPFTAYTVTLDPTAKSPFGYTLDGNGDGTPGDAFTLTFETGARDVVAPSIADTYPRSNGRDVARRPIISITFSEKLDPASVTADKFSLEPTAGGAAVPGTFQLVHVGDRSVVSFAPDAMLMSNTFYRFRIEAGLRDPGGNATENALQLVFRTMEGNFLTTPIESFEGDFTRNWWQPLQSGSTTGNVVGDSTRMAASASVVSPLGGTQAMALQYGWRTGENPPFLIRQYLNAGPATGVTFASTYKLQAYVFGDASGTLFRFAVNDKGPGGHEVSPWRAIDWAGWRLVEWNLSTEAPGTWIGDGKLDGDLSFDSFQIAYGGGAAFGTLFIDDLQLAALLSTDVESGEVPEAFTVLPNAPNPFNTRTTVAFTLPAPQTVRVRVFDTLGREVAVLMDGPAPAGVQRVVWDAQNLSSGTYLLRVEAGGQVLTRPLTLLR